MNDLISVFFIVILAVLTQTTSGFGIALVSMPLLVTRIGLTTAAPLVALIALSTRVAMIIRYRAAFRWSEVWRVMLAAAVGIPFGLLFFYRVEQRIVELVLGGIIIAYAAYSILRPRIRLMAGNQWAYGLGLLSGVLAGAYNIGGPPAVLYATGCRWPPMTFKGNLQLISLLTGALVILMRAFNQEFTEGVMTYYVVALPAIAVGTAIGFWLDRYLNAQRFRVIVLVLLMLVGVQLVL
ncbi:MAG: sulfite exporter TauE/SafE family protein [Chloroflexota bacterium]